MAFQQPPYEPNVENQTVDFGGVTWKGNPGQGWTPQTATGGAPMATGDPLLDATKYAQWAQQQQIAANQPAIATLQGQQGSLQSAYSTLLQSVMGQGTVAMNSAIKGENTLLGQRGITDPNSALYQQQLTQAELPVTAQNQYAAGQVGMGSAQDLRALAGEIAGLQSGNVPNSLSFGNNLASTEQQVLGQNIGLQEAQLKAATPFGVGNLVFNPSTTKFFQPPTGGGGNLNPIDMARMIAMKNGSRGRQPMGNISQFVQPS